MLVHWLWLAHRPGLSDRMKAVLLQHFQDPEDLYFADKEAFSHVEGISPEGMEALLDRNLIPAEQILEACQQEDLHILTCRDAAYPAALKNIPSDPWSQLCPFRLCT